MKKTLKNVAIVFALLALLFAATVIVWTRLVSPDQGFETDGLAEAEVNFIRIAEESEKIDINESNGILYVNNEMVVFVRPSATQEDIDAFLGSVDADVDKTMADVGVYKLVFGQSMTYSELEIQMKRIKNAHVVEDVYMNPVICPETDAYDDDFEYMPSLVPDDPWSGDVVWNVSVPRGVNWGMEAIDAPGAWGYLDRMSTVRIGLIDSMPELTHPDLNIPAVNSTTLLINEETGMVEERISEYVFQPDDHGTHVAGIMNASWNNTVGVSGVMGGKGEVYYCSVAYIRNGQVAIEYGTAFSYLLALKKLIDQDVQVINISQNTNALVGFAASHGNHNAINYLSLQADLAEQGLSRIIAAREKAGKPDFVICVSAGNSNSTYYYKDNKATYGYRKEMTDWENVKYLFGWRGEIGGSLAQYNNFLNLMDAEDVISRVVVVGALGIDLDTITPSTTRYKYAYYSNIGSRVDIVAPGGIPGELEIYSCIVNGYGPSRGTSMAAPHVAGVAGLVFACNPSLSGPDVKEILIASSTGRYYYGADYSGLLNAKTSVENALKTVDNAVERVLQTVIDNGMDLCFVVDTTGSMGDDIQNAKENMESILGHLGDKTENYRVALIDYRDYYDRTGNRDDYPYKVQLNFTNDNKSITAAINALNLGDGGDTKETVYSALMAAARLDWRNDAKKVIIILGDAAPLDPEPVTGYTFDNVLLALFNADIGIDYEDSDSRVVDFLDTSLINVYSIGIGTSADAADFFEDIAESTGGSYASVESAAEVGDAIIDSIEQVEIVQTQNVRVDFGERMAHQRIDLYSNQTYLFSMEANESGRIVINSIPADTYRWTSNSIYGGGTIEVDTGSRDAEVRVTRSYWFAPPLQLWQEHWMLISAIAITYLLVCAAVPVIVGGICIRIRRKKVSAAHATAVTRNIGKTIAGHTKTQPFAEGRPHIRNAACPVCGRGIMEGSRFCIKCGCDLLSAAQETGECVCAVCGKSCAENEVYCAACGNKLR